MRKKNALSDIRQVLECAGAPALWSWRGVIDMAKAVQQHTQSVLHGLVAKVASGAQFVVHAGIKINLGHLMSYD